MELHESRRKATLLPRVDGSVCERIWKRFPCKLKSSRVKVVHVRWKFWKLNEKSNGSEWNYVETKISSVSVDGTTEFSML